MENPRPLHQIIPRGSLAPKYSEPQEINEFTAILGERDEALLRLVEQRDESLTNLLMTEETRFGAVSKNRKARKQRSEDSQENRAQLGHGRSEGKFPAHPLLSTNAAQRYAGDDTSVVPAKDQGAQAQLEDVIVEAAKNDPTLTLQLSQELRMKLENELRNEKTMTNTPKLERR